MMPLALSSNTMVPWDLVAQVSTLEKDGGRGLDHSGLGRIPHSEGKSWEERRVSRSQGIS